MENNQFSNQEIVTLLAQLRKLRVEYPPDLLVAQRKRYLGTAAQVTATRITVDTKWKQWISSIMREPGSTMIKVLIVILVSYLIAFVAHAFATGNLDFGWLLDLLSR